MNTLESLVDKVINRIRPQSLAKIKQEEKTSLIFSISTAIVSLLSFIYWISSSFDTEADLIMMLLTLIPLSGTVLLLQDYFFRKSQYQRFMDMNASNYHRYYIYEYNDITFLTDDESKKLLEMDFSETNLAILHNAISGGSHLIFNDLADMYEQKIKEDRFTINQAKFVESGIYSDKQLTNLAQVASINGVKTNYKTFNSKSVL